MRAANAMAMVQNMALSGTATGNDNGINQLLPLLGLLGTSGRTITETRNSRTSMGLRGSLINRDHGLEGTSRFTYLTTEKHLLCMLNHGKL
jgi:hypothetical protein